MNVGELFSDFWGLFSPNFGELCSDYWDLFSEFWGGVISDFGMLFSDFLTFFFGFSMGVVFPIPERHFHNFEIIFSRIRGELLSVLWIVFFFPFFQTCDVVEQKQTIIRKIKSKHTLKHNSPETENNSQIMKKDRIPVIRKTNPDT